MKCEFCDSERKIKKSKHGDVCSLCYDTKLYNALVYPDQYPKETFQVIAQVGNIILEKLDKIEQQINFSKGE